MDNESKTTKNHEEIKKWVEERGGKPAVVKGTEEGGGGILRIEFSDGFKNENLEPISWEVFFDIFDESNLSFLYQNKLKNGEESRFFKFIERR